MAARKLDCDFCSKIPWNKGARRRCLCEGFNLDVGAGPHRQKGFVATDRRPIKGVDIVFDLEEFPWPLPSNSADQVLASHLVEHINPKYQFDFFNEVWRVMKPDGQFLVVVPHGSSGGFLQDPTHICSWSEATPAYYCPSHPSGLWNIYRCKPWNIERLHFSPLHNIECIFTPVKDKKLLKKLGKDENGVDL
jgi:SAM-dependent methyltransferase